MIKPYKQQTSYDLQYISSNNVRRPVTKTFTTLHYTSPNYTSLCYTCWHFVSNYFNFPNYTSIHFTTLSFGLTPFKFPTTQFHLTSLHFTSLHCTTLLDDFCHTSFAIHFTLLIIAYLTPFLKILGLQGKVPNASVRSWFQFLMVLFTKEYFLTPQPRNNTEKLSPTDKVSHPRRFVSSKWLTTLNFGGGCGMSPGSSALCDMLVRSSPHTHVSGPAPSVPIDEHCAITGQLSLLWEGETRDGITACFFSRCPRRRWPHLSLSGPRWEPGTEAKKKTL
jgi:hypothetical protein